MAFLPPLSGSFPVGRGGTFLEETGRSSVGFTSSSPLLGGVLFDLVSYPFLGVLTRVWSGFFSLSSGGSTQVWSSATF